MIERRQHPTDTSPRATYAATNVSGRCEYVHVGSEAYRYMRHHGFTELLTDASGGALLLPPAGWSSGSILSRNAS